MSNGLAAPTSVKHPERDPSRLPLRLTLRLLLLLLFVLLQAPWPGSGADPPGLELDIPALLLRLRRESLERSPEVLIARAQAEQFAAARNTALSRWFPRLDLELAQSNIEDYSIITSGSIGVVGFNLTPEAVSLARWALNLNFPVFRREVQLGYLQASAEGASAEQTAQNKVSEIDWRAHSLLGNYLIGLYREATLESAIAAAAASLREIERRHRLGSRTRLDLLRARANLASLRFERSSAAQTRLADLNGLSEYTGASQERLVELGLPEVASETTLSRAIARLSGVQGLEKALSPYLERDARLERAEPVQSPNFLSILLQEEAAERRARSATASLWPALSFQASLNKQQQAWAGILGPNFRSHSLALVLTIPLFSGGSSFTQIPERHQAARKAALESGRDRVRLRNEIANDTDRVRVLQSSISSLELAVAQNMEAMNLAERSYQLGRSSLSDVLASRSAATRAKLDLANAKIELSVLLKRLAWNLGVPVS